MVSLISTKIIIKLIVLVNKKDEKPATHQIISSKGVNIISFFHIWCQQEKKKTKIVTIIYKLICLSNIYGAYSLPSIKKYEKK